VSEQTQAQGNTAMMPMSAAMPAMNIRQAIQRRNALTEFVKSELMVESRDFGKVPGTDKDTLLKPGAEKLLTYFGLVPILVPVVEETDWTGERHNGEPFIYFKYRCDIYLGDTRIAASEGLCSSMEKKYRYRNAERVCPQCGKPAIKRSKYPPRNNPSAEPGWYCYDKIGGCGYVFEAGDPAITKQQLGQVINPDIADVANTICKMAQKRALVGSTLIALNASEFFTQDVEDMEIIEGSYSQKEPQKQTQQPQQKQASQKAEANKNPLDALIEQSQALIDKPPATGLSDKAANTIKANWQKLFEMARNEGAPLVEAVAADAKLSVFLAAIVAQGTKLREFRAAVAQSEAVAKQADPEDISEWTGAK